MEIVGDLCAGQLVFRRVETWKNELVVGLEEVDIRPVVFVGMRNGEMEFVDFEMRFESVKELRAE